MHVLFLVKRVTFNMEVRSEYLAFGYLYVILLVCLIWLNVKKVIIVQYCPDKESVLVCIK